MNFNKCPTCGKPSVRIDGLEHCLYCGRVQEPAKEKKIPLQRQLDTNKRIVEQAHQNLLNNIDGSLDYCQKRGSTPYTI